MAKSIQNQNADIENRFSYHPPKAGQPRQYAEIRDMAKVLAYTLIGECPASRELSLALTHLEDTVMWGCKAIARHGKTIPDGAEPEARDNYGLPDSFTSDQVARFTTRKMEARDLSKGDAVDASPVYALKQALLRDRDYLLGWHANIACAVSDARGAPFEDDWEHGQEAARWFIGVLFADDDQKPRPITNEEVRGGLKDDRIPQPEASDGPPPNTGMGWEALQRSVQERARREHEKRGEQLAELRNEHPIPQSPADDSVLIDMLGLVDVTVTRADLTRWTPDMAKEAEEWAGAVHLSASDHEDVVVPPKPGFLPASDTELHLHAAVEDVRQDMGAAGTLGDPPPARLEPDDDYNA